jgi:hypothetical protein
VEVVMAKFVCEGKTSFIRGKVFVYHSYGSISHGDDEGFDIIGEIVHFFVAQAQFLRNYS